MNFGLLGAVNQNTSAQQPILFSWRVRFAFSYTIMYQANNRNGPKVNPDLWLCDVALGMKNRSKLDETDPTNR